MDRDRIEKMRAAGKAGYLDLWNPVWNELCDLALRALPSAEPVAWMWPSGAYEGHMAFSTNPIAAKLAGVTPLYAAPVREEALDLTTRAQKAEAALVREGWQWVKKEDLLAVQQAFMEFAHAQESGPDWYTRGESGLRAQVRLWIGKGATAIKTLRFPPRRRASK